MAAFLLAEEFSSSPGPLVGAPVEAVLSVFLPVFSTAGDALVPSATWCTEGLELNTLYQIQSEQMFEKNIHTCAVDWFIKTFFKNFKNKYRKVPLRSVFQNP